VCIVALQLAFQLRRIKYEELVLGSRFPEYETYRLHTGVCCRRLLTRSFSLTLHLRAHDSFEALFEERMMSDLRVVTSFWVLP